MIWIIFNGFYNFFCSRLRDPDTFRPTSLTLIHTFANIGNKMIEKTRKTAGNINIYSVIFYIFESVSLIKKADNTYYPILFKFKLLD